MNDPAVFGPQPLPKPEPEPEPVDWKAALAIAPRWQLTALLLIAITALGTVGNMLFAEKSARRAEEAVQKARIEDGLADAQARLIPAITERLAVIETEVTVIKAQQVAETAAKEKLTAKVEALVVAMVEQTTQMRLFTAAVVRLEAKR